jgi:regulator of replication initiation timing
MNEESMATEINNIKTDLKEFKAEIKENVKEQNKSILDMRDTKIRTEMVLEQIKKTQEDANKNQALMLDKLQELRDEPRSMWQQMSLTWKIGTGLAIISYIIGTVGGYVKMFIK